MSRIGENIKKARLQAGMGEKQLAKKLGVSEKFICEVEMGRKVVNETVINRISKILGKDLNDINMYVDEEKQEEIRKDYRKETLKMEKTKDVNEVWSGAFASVLKTVPVYKYNLKEVINTKQLPIVGNKVEGYSQDKVSFIEIEESDMIGFRIARGDIALGHFTQEIENNSIFLIEYKGERIIRQIKKLDNNKILLINNGGTVRTETTTVKNIKVLMKLDKLEIKL